VRGAINILLRNWPLKLGAVALSVLLYVGLVATQNVRVWPGNVPIEPINQPSGTYLLADLGEVVSVRYLAPLDAASQVSRSSFVATADLAGVQARPGGVPVSVPVTVVAPDPRIQVLGWSPTTVAARLDPVVSRDVPVAVDHGTVPAGLTLGDPTISRPTVSVRGASSLVSRISRALARVSVDASGINVDSDVELVAVDDVGNPVAPVNIDPSSVHVRILVGEQLSSRTVPVVPTVTGDLALGYGVRDVQVTPLTVTVAGTPSALASLTSIPTAPVNVAGRSSDLVADAPLAPPQGVAVQGVDHVQVKVRVVSQSGSRSFGTGIALEGARPDRTYALSVPDVLVTLGGSRAALDAIDPSTLAASVDVGGLDAGISSVAVRFAPPSGTTLVAISPSRVDVTVTMPAASPSPSVGP
jgi:YbbR domain-containing protein